MLNVSNSGLLTLGNTNLYLGWVTGAGTGVVNLSGGTISTKQVLLGSTTSGMGIFNFDGGVLQAAPSANAAFLTGLTSAYVYGGGVPWTPTATTSPSPRPSWPPPAAA